MKRKTLASALSYYVLTLPALLPLFILPSKFLEVPEIEAVPKFFCKFGVDLKTLNVFENGSPYWN